MDTNEYAADHRRRQARRPDARRRRDGTARPAAQAAAVVLAIDIGGTKFAAGLVSARGELLDRAVVLVDQNVGPEAHFKSLAGIVEQQLDAADRHDVRIAAVGIGSAGPITRNCETISPVNIPAWRGFPLRSRLRELTGAGSTATSTARRWPSPRAGRARPRATTTTAC